MRKDSAGKTDWVKHTRNSQWGKRGHNKRVRREVQTQLRKGKD